MNIRNLDHIPDCFLRMKDKKCDYMVKMPP